MSKQGEAENAVHVEAENAVHVQLTPNKARGPAISRKRWGGVDEGLE